jgi:CHAD domain-containing protein
MLQFTTPDSLFSRERVTLSSLLPGVRDGGVDAVHDARVSSRRIRELVPLLTTRCSPAEVDRLAAAFKDMTRTLGKTRDRDVMLSLLDCAERQLPQLARDTGRLHAALREKRERVMRKTLKRLERIDVDEVLASVDGLQPRRFAFRESRAWRDVLRQQLADRAGDVRQNIARAGGVYFPNRLHGSRVALKKLRYTVEIATATGLFDGRALLGPLKKAQDILGRIQDREVLAAFADRDQAAAAALVPILAVQQQELHRRYLRRREDLLAIADALASQPRVTKMRPAALLAAGAMPIALFVVRRAAKTA